MPSNKFKRILCTIFMMNVLLSRPAICSRAGTFIGFVASNTNKNKPSYYGTVLSVFSKQRPHRHVKRQVTNNSDNSRIIMKVHENENNSLPSPTASTPDESIPIHLAEGLCAVQKPIGWTSQDVVSYIRGMLERDARERGAKLAKRRSKSKNKIKVGHGGTLDPLAEGVLVLGVGKGTKELQQYLTGAKVYRAGAKLGFETTTLDMEGNITKTSDDSVINSVSLESIQDIIPKFTGTINQIPPIYSAIRKNGKRLYEEARKGVTAEELGIEPREVVVYEMSLLAENDNGEGLPCFGLAVHCGGGTYIRSLVRDIGDDLGSFATMTSLVRTQQGPFGLDMALVKDDWNADTIYDAVRAGNEMLKPHEEFEQE